MNQQLLDVCGTFELAPATNVFEDPELSRNQHVNAHSGSDRLKGQSDEPIVAECERMVAVIDAQMSDLQAFLDGLETKRQEWSKRLDRARARDFSAIPPRAPHGAVKALILQELDVAGRGLDMASLLARISPRLPMINQRSVRQALIRLAEEDKVAKTGIEWALKT